MFAHKWIKSDKNGGFPFKTCGKELRTPENMLRNIGIFTKIRYILKKC